MRTVQPAKEGAPPTIRPAGNGTLPAIRLATILGLLATAALLGVLSLTTGLSVAGWIVGLAAGWTTTALLVAARVRSDQPAIFPADWVTLTRALLIAGVAGLVADSFARPVPGHRAGRARHRRARARRRRRSGGAAYRNRDPVRRPPRRRGRRVPHPAAERRGVPRLRRLGAGDRRLPVRVPASPGGSCRGWPRRCPPGTGAGSSPPYRASCSPSRHPGCLTAARSAMIAVGVALLLLAESFGRDVVWLYRTGAGPSPAGCCGASTAVGAVAVVWVVLVAPDRLELLTPAPFVRIPVEALVLVAIALVLPRPTTTDRGDRRRGPLRSAHCRQALRHGVLRGVRSARSTRCSTGATSARHRRRTRLHRNGGHRRHARPRRARPRAGRRIITVAAVRLTSDRPPSTWLGRRLAAARAVWGLGAGLSLQVAPGEPLASASATAASPRAGARRPDGAA